VKRRGKNKWKQAVSMCLVFQMAVTSPAAAVTLPAGKQQSKFNTGQYAAVLDPSAGGGSLALFNGSRPDQAWNTMDEALVPGTTMLWDGSSGFRKLQITPEAVMSAGLNSGAATGIRLGNEAEGVKSWFLFEDEIICAGAGVKVRKEESGRLVTIVDTIPVTDTTKLALTNPNNGFRLVRTASKEGGLWASLIDTVTQGVHTQRNWLSASSGSGASNSLDWSYVFGSGESGSYLTKESVYYRLNTKETYAAQLAELFLAPQETYQYTLVAGGTTDDYSNKSLYQTDARLLINTTAVQAAADVGEGAVAITKWEPGSVRVDNQVVPVTMDYPAALELKKDSSTGNIELTAAVMPSQQDGILEVILETAGKQILANSNPDALQEAVMGEKVILKFDTAAMKGNAATVTIEGKVPDTLTGEEITLVRGSDGRIKAPESLQGAIRWEVKIPKPDGSFVRNAGSSKIKRELKEGETDGDRKAGDADGSHIASVRGAADGYGMITAREKGTVTIVATDEYGTSAKWQVTVLYEDPDNLPEADSADYAAIRKRWKESIIGADLTAVDGGTEILETIDGRAMAAWEAYAYREQDSCQDIPWPEDAGAAGNADIAYEDDAVEFRPAFKKVLAMASAYAAKGSRYYKDSQMLSDMKHILNWLCSNCYTPKTQTDNWWTWEIGLPKDLIPALVLLYDDLTPEETALYTEALYFFQPDPYHEGLIGTGSTHAQGYRTAQGANIIDCSRTALGLGVLREDNELVYLASKAASETFVIQSVEDSTKIADQGYTSGFYADGSYLDHSHVPYLGSYGIEFLKGGVGLPPLLAKSPWDFPREVQENLEFYLKEGFLNGIYNGLMMDSLKGRSVSRPGASDRDSGREAMALMIQLMNSVSPEVEEELKGALKTWIDLDPGFLDTLTGAENMAVKEKAIEIRDDDSIVSSIQPVHKNMPLMDRAVHRTDDFQLALSMYSERIQNTEIMNHENRYGWHQGSGMTYLYNRDILQYTENFWNTVNPLRLAGTTVVSKDIGTGQPDSSGFAQGGDFRSKESWVGGSTIGTNGINGMSMTGEVRVKEGEGSPSILYAPEFSAKKSWFMFGGQIVCLGAGITNTGETYPVESIIENRRLRPEEDNVLTVNGEVEDLPVQEADLEDIVAGSIDVSGTRIPEVSWAHLEGNVEGSDIGYYFPGGDQTVSVRKGRNAGDWSLIGTSKGEALETYLEMWFDHGANPENEAYEYVLLPGLSAEETEAYSKEPGITILKNTPEIQAAATADGLLTGVNFWTDGQAEIGAVAASRAASVMTEEDEDGVLTIAVSDPTMKNSGSVTVDIKRPAEEILTHDENVDVQLTENGVRLVVHTKGTNGNSSYASVRLTPSVIPPSVEHVVELITQAAETAEAAGDYGAFDVVKAVKTAVSAVWSVSNEELAEYCMKDLLVLEELYREVMAARGNRVEVRVETPEHMESPVTAAGLLLSVPWDDSLMPATPSQAKKATASNAGYKAFGAARQSAAPSTAIPSTATPSTATPSTADSPASASSKEKKEAGVRAAVHSVILTVTENSDADWPEDRPRGDWSQSYKFQLCLEDENGVRSGPVAWKAPANVWMQFSEDEVQTDTIRAYSDNGSGEVQSLSVSLEEAGRICFVLPDSARVYLTGDKTTAAEEIFQVSIEEDLTGGRITASPMSGKKGTKVTVQAVPQSGYRLASLSANGKSLTADSDGRCTFVLREDTHLTGVFKRSGSSSSGSASGSSSGFNSGWKKSGEVWYYYDTNGRKTTGWLLDNGKWYWLDSSGAMKTGWLLNESDGFWYYLKPDGSMAEGWNSINGVWYYFAPQTEGSPGWSLVNGRWVYEKPEASYRPHGAMYSGCVTPDGYTVAEDGAWNGEDK